MKALILHRAIVSFGIGMTLFCSKGSAQSPEGFTCEQFQTMVQDKLYDEAFKCIMANATGHCLDKESQYAKATLLAASNMLAEAEAIAKELLEKHPKDQEILALGSRIESLLNLPGQDYSTELNAINEGPEKDQMIAYVTNDELIALVSEAPELRYFPARKTIKHAGYKLATEVTDSSTSPLLNALVDWDLEDLGPIAKLPDGRFVVSALPEKRFALRPLKYKLYLLDVSSGKSPLPLPFCGSDADYMHPSYDEKNQCLIFSSDKPGGQGGMDLWKVKYAQGEWGEPINLGTEINTGYHELFAFSHGDSLYYASNRPDKGYGGVDIYCRVGSTGFSNPLAAPVNSPYDDFGIHITSSAKGYIVSNRPNRSDTDQMYTFQWENKQLYFEVLRGNILGLDNPAGAAIYLLSQVGDTLHSSALDDKGNFKLPNVRGLRNYQIAVEAPKALSDELLELRLYGENDEVIKLLRSKASKGFLFELLTPEDYFMERMHLEDKSILDVDILGRYLQGSDEGIPEKRILLQDSNDETIAKAYTDEQGLFKFESVRPDRSYTIQAEGVRAGAVIHVLDEKGNVLQRIEPEEDKSFIYVKVKPDVKVITLTNEMQQKVVVPEESVFELALVYFDFNSSEINKDSQRYLSKLLSILNQNQNIEIHLEGHTDAQGAADYNQKLSQKRVDAVRNFLLNNGIDPSRVSGRGYGESRLLNHCADGVVCTDEEHAVNRRIEFKINEAHP